MLCLCDFFLCVSHGTLLTSSPQALSISSSVTSFANCLLHQTISWVATPSCFPCPLSPRVSCSFSPCSILHWSVYFSLLCILHLTIFLSSAYFSYLLRRHQHLYHYSESPLSWQIWCIWQMALLGAPRDCPGHTCLHAAEKLGGGGCLLLLVSHSFFPSLFFKPTL